MTVGQRQALTPFSIDAVPDALKGGVVAVGNFDGVHRGHAELLGRAQADARKLGVPTVALTFEPHPRTFFRPQVPVFRLTPIDAKVRLLTALGVDGVIVAEFDRAFASISAEDFIASVLRDRLELAGAAVGFNFHFGRGRAGTPGTLKAAGERLGFAVDVVAPVGETETAPIASTAIREFLAAGDVSAANRLLGYRWFVIGEVARGAQRGRELGFPTANLELASNCTLRHGIYAVRLQRADGTIHDGVASYGRRPTFDNGPPLLEAFLFDFSNDLYGERVAVSLLGWIRAEARFPSADALIAAMKVDCEAARAILASSGPGTALDQTLSTIGP